MFKNGEIQLAWFGGLTGVQARHAVEGARAIVQGEKDPEFYSYFIAHADAGLDPSDEFPVGIATKKFTFGSRSSTSGRLMPEFFIMENTGKTAAEFFTITPSFSGSHDKTAELVASGQFEAGVLNYAVYDRLVSEGKTDGDVCRVIWKTPTFADYNMTAHPDLDVRFGAGFIDRVQKALIDMNDERLLAAFGRARLIPAGNEDFEGIRAVALKLDMLR
jgi:phosphonate transport system substrate-binding protein